MASLTPIGVSCQAIRSLLVIFFATIIRLNSQLGYSYYVTLAYEPIIANTPPPEHITYDLFQPDARDVCLALVGSNSESFA